MKIIAGSLPVEIRASSLRQSVFRRHSAGISSGLAEARARNAKGRHHNARRGLGLLLIAALVGCSSNAPSNGAASAGKGPSIQQLLETAHSTTLEQRAPYLHDAAVLALRQHDAQQAERILREFGELKLTPRQRAQGRYLAAWLQLEQKQPAQALTTLQDRQLQQDLHLLTQREQIDISLLRADALLQNRNYFASVQELIFVDAQLAGDESKKNRRRIWDALQDLAPAELERQCNAAPANSPLRGWLELALIARRGATQQVEFAEWQRRWPNHPAARDLPPQFAQAQQTQDSAVPMAGGQPARIAMLLPLSGKLAAFGMALRDGFMAAWYDAQRRGENPPPVQFYDTDTSADVVQLYGQAVADGAGVVIGPLEKQQVARLYQQDLAVPTLALNRFDSEHQSGPNLYQFSLAAEDETEQIADIAADEQRRSALIIAPEDELNSRELQAFEQRWRERGGHVGAIARYRDQQSMSQEIRAALNIQRSEARAKEIESILNRRIEFTPRRRQDIDMVFMLAKPAQARVIKPLLDFYYAGDLAVYSTSRIYTGYPIPRLDRDLDKVRFTEMPFVVESGELKQQILAAQPHARNYMRLYAMGIDSFALYPLLLNGQPVQAAAVPGQTGRLTIDAGRVVHRQSLLAVMRNGSLNAATAPEAGAAETSPPPENSIAPVDAQPADPALPAEETSQGDE